MTVPGPEIDRVREAARRADVAVVLGISEREGGTCYNTQVHISETGALVGVHRKLQPTYAERTVWGQGDASTLSVFDTRVGRVGGLVCWEHTMNLARHALIGQGEQVHAASWPDFSTLPGFADVWAPQVEAMSRSHAITGQCFVVVAMSPFTQQMVDVMAEALGPQEFQAPGGAWSAIIAPSTTYLAGPHTGLEDRLLVADIDLDEIAGLHVFVDATGHYSRKDLLRLVVDAAPKHAVDITGPRAPRPVELVPPQAEDERV